MNFREYANTETSAFIERLTAAAEAATQNAIHEVRSSADTELARFRSDAERYRHDVEQLRAQLDAETSRASEALAQLDAAASEAQNAWQANEAVVQNLRSALESARAETLGHADRVAALEGQLHAAPAEPRAPVGALLTESIDAFDALATAATLDELFTKLVQQMAAQFPRVVIFRRKGQRLEGDLATGLEDSVDLADFTIAMNADSIITTAATQGVYESATAEQLADSHRLPGEVPSFAVAAPLVFQGETLAVVYADTRQHDKGDAHAAFAGVLAAHTNVLLSRLTQELKVARELREYAQMLLHEAEEMFVADTKEGRSEADRLRRLRDTVDFGRQLYAQRAALEGPGAAGLLEEEIASLVHTAPMRAFTAALADALADAAALAGTTLAR